MISAIVYTSNSGYTAEYARMLGELTGLPVNDLRQVHNPQPQREVIFLGWIMADNVMGYAKASRFYKVRAVCQVGMGPATQAASDKLRQKLKLGRRCRCSPCRAALTSAGFTGPTSGSCR